VWEGRFESLNKGDWNNGDQLFQFPNKLVHDDLPDALSYIEQLAKVAYVLDFEEEEYEYLDTISGY
jgi:hypothetical protein